MHTEAPTVTDPAHLLADAPASALAQAVQGVWGHAHKNSLVRARSFAEPLIEFENLETGENTLAHADAMVNILALMGGSNEMQVAAYLVYACQSLNRPQDVIAKAFGEQHAELAIETNKLVHLQRQARQKAQAAQASKEPSKAGPSELDANQTENVRKMLLAFSRDLRVVMLRLASRLQTLRYFAAEKRQPPEGLAYETLHVFAPLANRLGIWQIKWEMEDLSFRFLEPVTYKHIAKLLDEKRVERESHVEQVRQQLEDGLKQHGVAASVQGRPKHIYSIVKKMRGKSLPFEQVFDIRALRVVVPSVDDCYTALAHVHAAFVPELDEFDDYIAKPKPNGYQSLHTVVRDGDGRAFEIQIRTQDMHDHAENGVAAHWAYKEAGTKGYAGVSASSDYDAKIAVLRQLLAWQRDLSGTAHGLFDDCIYVLTPHAAIVELPTGATPVDFAYHLHTNLGHRCRGAKVDGTMVPLNTALQNGQTVEIVAAKEGGPSRDWLNPEGGYLVSHRAKSKVKSWFNAQAAEESAVKGREAIEKLLQREGKTAVRMEDLAAQLGLDKVLDMFEAIGKDELSLRAIEQIINPPEPVAPQDEVLIKKSRHSAKGASGAVLVDGMGSVMTQLAKCCKPAPPDDIGGFVARAKGVSIHRTDCPDFLHMSRRWPERVMRVQWAGQRSVKPGETAYFPVDVTVQAHDRQGLLRDISDVFAREKVNVIGVQTQSVKGVAWMTFTVEVTDTHRVSKVMSAVADVEGVKQVRRR